MTSPVAEQARNWAIAASVVPILLDGLILMIWEPLSAAFSELLQSPGYVSAYTIFGLYLLYVISLAMLGFLKPSRPIKSFVVEAVDAQTGRKTRTKMTWPEMLLVYPSVGFGVVMITAMTEGLFASPDMTVDDHAAGLLVAATVLLIVHVGVWLGDWPRYSPEQPRYLALLTPIVLIGGVTLNFSATLWDHMFMPDPGAAAVEDPSVLASFVVMSPIFLLFFAAPRFSFLKKSFTWPSFCSGLGLALFGLWLHISEHPIL